MTDSYNRFHALDENDRIDDPDTDLEPSNLSVLNSFGWLLLMETPNKAIQNYPDASITLHTLPQVTLTSLLKLQAFVFHCTR